MVLVLALSFFNRGNGSSSHYNCTTYSHEDNFEIHCSGDGLADIPSDLNTTLNKLIVSDTKNITKIINKSLVPYKMRLQDVVMYDLPNLRVIEEGSFADIPDLSSMYVNKSLKITR